MLRIGDFSLYSIENGIIGTGELKSRRNDNNTITVQVHIFSKYRINVEKQGELIDTQETPEILCQERLNRQIESITSLLKKPKPYMHQNIYSDNAFCIVDDFYKIGQHVRISKDKAVLAFGICSRSTKLCNNLLSSKEENKSLTNELSDKVVDILIKNSRYNQIVFGQVDNKLCHGQVPIFWWGINMDTIEKIIFQQLIIITLYNPAHLYEYFSNMGFTITISNKHQALIEKRDGKKKITIGNLDQFNHLIISNFLPIKIVIEASKGVIDKFENGEIETNAKVNLSVCQRTF